MSKNISFGIVISTYRRPDGTIPFYLNRAIKSIFDQTHQDFKIFLMGDKYENEDEVHEIIERYDKSRIVFENLPYAKEREKYSGLALWSYAGVNTCNIAIDKAMKDGLEYLCHLDHDDWWYENHLQLINKYILQNNSDFICTKSTFKSKNLYLPNIRTNKEYVEFLPREAGLIHSSACVNFKNIPLRYRDLMELTGEIGRPSDADMWERAREIILEKKLNSGFINVVTCRHDEEGFELRKF